jgi:hypothetical protein
MRWRTARRVAYPATGPRLTGPAWPWALTLRPILLAALAIAAVLSIQFLRRGRSAPAHAGRGQPREIDDTARRRT